MRRRATSFAVLALGLLWACAWFVPSFARSGGAHTTGEWLFFKVGAFALLGDPRMATHPLQLYVENPALQIGPPAFVLVAVAMKLSSPAVATVLFPTLMAAGGSVCAGLTQLRAASWSRAAACWWAVPCAAATAVCAYEVGTWRHLDDVLVLLFVAGALLALRRDRALAAGLLLGLAAATKPWAVVVAPLLLALPRDARPRAALAYLLGAALPWLPFVLAAPDTLGALGGFHLVPDADSVPYLLGLRGDQAAWLRSTQFAAAGCACAWSLVVRRRTAEEAALAAVAVKLLFDPYFFGYYGLAPLALAVLVDLRRRRAVPATTVLVLLAFFAGPELLPVAVSTALRLLLCLALLLGTDSADPRPTPDAPGPAARQDAAPEVLDEVLGRSS